MTSRIPLLATVLLVLVVGVAATACGADSLHSAMGHDSSDMSHNDMMGGSASGAMTHSAAAMGTGHTADVMFTQQMIPHHQQAVDMANLALDPAHEASPAVKNLATRIKTAQTGGDRRNEGVATGMGCRSGQQRGRSHADGNDVVG